MGGGVKSNSVKCGGGQKTANSFKLSGVFRQEGRNLPIFDPPRVNLIQNWAWRGGGSNSPNSEFGDPSLGGIRSAANGFPLTFLGVSCCFFQPSQCRRCGPLGGGGESPPHNFGTLFLYPKNCTAAWKKKFWPFFLKDSLRIP